MKPLEQMCIRDRALAVHGGVLGAVQLALAKQLGQMCIRDRV